MDALPVSLIAGGFTILGAAIAGLIAFLSSNANRKASVRDQAYKESVEACAEFIGASHLLIGRDRDLISALDRIKIKYPEDSYIGNRLDNNTLLEIVHPLTERFYNVATRAELLAPTSQSAENVHDMAALHAVVGGFVNQGMYGQLAEGWKDEVDWYIRKHDEISIQLIEHLREVGAETSYRQSVSRGSGQTIKNRESSSGAQASPAPVDDPRPDVQH